MKLSKKVKYEDDADEFNIIFDGAEKEMKAFEFELCARELCESICYEEIKENDFAELKEKLSEKDFKKLRKAAGIEGKSLGDFTFYKTRDGLSAYYVIRSQAENDKELLLCFGCGEVQPMRYVITLEAIYELE